MIVKRRKGKQAAEAWSLNWCEPLMAQTGDVNDLNDWLFLVTSTKCLIQNSTHDYNALQFYA